MREFAKRILPKRVLNWYRRRRALRGYLKDLSRELVDRQLPLDPREIEGELAAKRQGFYEGLVKDVLERTDLVLQELDRRIAGVSTRHGAELERLREELAELRATVQTLAGHPRLGAPEPRAATGARD